jgi:hypothetical protein
MAYRLDGPASGDRGTGKAAEDQPVRVRYDQGHSLQIDGEVIHVDANSQVIIDCVFHALTTVG